MYANSTVTIFVREKGCLSAGKKTLRLPCRPQASGHPRVSGPRQERERLTNRASNPCPAHPVFLWHKAQLQEARRARQAPKESHAPTHLSAPGSLWSSQDPTPLKRLHVQTQPASGAQLQQQIAPGDQRHQPISARRVGRVPPPAEARTFPICSCSRLQW